MAHKRIISFTVFLAICFFIGVTWGDSNSSKAGNDNNNVSALVQPSTKAATSLVSLVNATLATKVISTTGSAPINKTSSATKCVCDGDPKELENCAKCECKHEARNSTLIKVVVIIVIWIISILVIYMLFLMCLDPLLNKRVKANYQEHTNEDDDPTTTPPIPTSGTSELNSRANVLNRVGHQQDKWKRQVREQRRHIYDRRTMLN